jgi:uncharacterized protein YyaL (SSP411 family)
MPGVANRLAAETSPYLLQHAHNPVDWYPWGDEALAAARAGSKPIFLSIGYAACHWCHVMERESFEDAATAAQLNRDFVAIKVDREERPDLDQLYMGAVVAMTGQGGWPMSVFLTPDGKPFYGGTYFPDEPRHGMPSFRQVLGGVRRAWDEDREGVEGAGGRIVQALIEGQGGVGPTGPDGAPRPLPGREVLEAAVAAIEAGFDARNGGWGGAPKFPQPMTIEFLLRRSLTGNGRALAMARRSLDKMADGGIRDQLGGGFHRYATDAVWLVPHFEQMLYDNAQLARVYLHAWQATGERRYLAVAEGTLGYMLRELRRDDGAFAASQDADTDGVEGATFTWTPDELGEALGADRAARFGAAFGVTDRGNFEGRSVLSRPSGPSPEPASEAALESDRARLLAARAERAQPARDDKALAAWNGLAIAAFAEAAVALRAKDPAAAAGYLDVAEAAAVTITGSLLDGDGRLRRSWKDGRATAPGVLEDYADLADGLLALYGTTFDERWFVTARRLNDTILERFADPAGGFFDVADDHERLVARPKDLQDNAVPSGGAMATTVLLKLAAVTGEGRYAAAAEGALRQVGPYLARHPTAFAQWLIAADLLVEPVVEVAVVGHPGETETARLLAPALEGFRPRQVVAVGADVEASRVPLLHGRFQLDRRPTAFVCRGFACRLPVNEPEALAALLVEAEAPDAPTDAPTGA